MVAGNTGGAGARNLDEARAIGHRLSQLYRGTRFLLFLLINANSLSGILSCLDGYMNTALEQTEEHVEGKVTNRYGDVFICNSFVFQS